MPSNKIHCAISKRRTGRTYEALHRWIDDNKEDRSVNHRSQKHYYSEEYRQYVFANFGEDEAVSEWLFHIALDNLDTSVTNDWNNGVSDNNFHVFGFGENGFIYYNEDEFSEEELEEQFD